MEHSSGVWPAELRVPRCKNSSPIIKQLKTDCQYSVVAMHTQKYCWKAGRII